MSEMGEYKFAIIFTLIIALIIGAMVFIEFSKESRAEAEEKAAHEAKLQELARYNHLTDEQNPVATITMEDGKKIVLELYPKIAPTTVENFIELANSGYYDGLTFHRTDPNFVIQGGDKEGTGFGKIEYTIEGEFAANGIKNSLKHTEGIISMARSNENDSAGSQFFIMLGKADWLDDNYAAFGRVIAGMDIVEAIEKREVVSDSQSGKLAHNLVLKKAVIDLKGKDYPEVAKVD